jgi:hypothetical protein
MTSTHRHTAGIARCGLAVRLRGARTRTGSLSSAGACQHIMQWAEEGPWGPDPVAADVSACRRAARASRRFRPGTFWIQTARESH